MGDREIGADDVSAVVLTLGEPSTERALDSVARQTWPPFETIVVEGVAPFHRALNEGAARVRSEFFVQVDADMLLDADCFERLRRAAVPGVGAVYAALRDPLEGPIVGVRLLRRQCFEGGGFPDSISPDTDFIDRICARGWRRVDLRSGGASPMERAALGEHRPDYTPEYTYRRYRLLGSRYRYRGHIESFRRRFRRLQLSEHPAHEVALIGAANGLFICERSDCLSRLEIGSDSQQLVSFLAGARGRRLAPVPQLPEGGSVREAFARLHDLGRELAEREQPDLFRMTLRALGRTASEAGFAATLGLGRGLLSQHLPGSARAEGSWLESSLVAVTAPGNAAVGA